MRLRDHLERHQSPKRVLPTRERPSPPAPSLIPAWSPRDQRLWRRERSGEWWKRISYWWTFTWPELEAMASMYL